MSRRVAARVAAFLSAAFISAASLSAAVSTGGLAAPDAPAASPGPTMTWASVIQQDDASHRHLQYNLPADPAVRLPGPGATPRLTSSSAPAAAPRARYNPGGQSREVFGYMPYWELGANVSDVQYGSLSTVDYFGLSLDASGNFINDAGMTGWQSSALTSVITQAHNAGDRVVLTGKTFDPAAISSIVNNPTTNGQRAIVNLINAIRSSNRVIDGINIDFEAGNPSDQGAFTAWVHSLSDQMHSAAAGTQLTVATYASAASVNNGFWRVDALAPYVDAFFVMGYDFNRRNTLPNAPLTGPYNYTDAAVVDQFLAAVNGDGAKVILGVPYYGYKYSTQNPSFHAPLNGACSSNSCVSVTYADIQADLTCGAQQLQRNWDDPSQTPWAAWFSPASGDPCGGNHGTYRETYYDDARSLGAKYDLVNNKGLRGAGMWALGFDHGYGDLWQAINAHIYECPVTPAQSTVYQPGSSVVAAAGTDCTMWVHQAGAPGFTPLGGVLTAAPAMAQAAGQSPLYISTSNDHNLWVRNDTTGWSPLLSGGSVYCVDNPAATVVGSTLYVGCTGGDGALWAGQGPVGSGLPQVPQSSFHSLGGILTTGPAVAQVAGQVTYMGLGTDRQVWSRTAATGWSPMSWYCQGHPALASDAATAYFACDAVDSALWYAVNTGTGWSPAQGLGGVLRDGPGVAAWAGNPVFFVQGSDGAVWQRGISTGWTTDSGQVRHGVGALAVH